MGTTAKKNLGKLLALYPTPVTVIGAFVDGKPNWLVVTHVGIFGHDHVTVSMLKAHFTTHGVRDSRKLSINIVDQDWLEKADYVGSVSGDKTDKSHEFEYHLGENGSPIIDDAKLAIECDVEDIYDTNNFDNFICTIANTYADEAILDEKGKIDYNKFRPVVFEFPTYSYLATDGIIGKCRKMHRDPFAKSDEEIEKELNSL